MQELRLITCPTHRKAGAMNASETESIASPVEGATTQANQTQIVDPKTSSIHAQKGAVVDTKTSATAELKTFRFIL